MRVVRDGGIAKEHRDVRHHYADQCALRKLGLDRTAGVRSGLRAVIFGEHDVTAGFHDDRSAAVGKRDAVLHFDQYKATRAASLLAY